jgi:predicted exporter
MIRPSRGLVIGVWIAMLAACAVFALQARYTADLSGFLPAAPTSAQRLLVEQLSSGPASRMLLVAIEGDIASKRERLSRELVTRLRSEPLFSYAGNGEPLSADGEYLLRNRYVLSEAVQPERFTVAGLRSAVEETLQNLSSPAGLLLADLLPRDPTGETAQLAQQLEDESAGPRSSGGVWSSRDGSQALLVLRTAANGADTDQQEAALARLQERFAALNPGAARLVVSGPGVFAVEARAGIIREALRLSVIGSLLTAALLLYVYRSFPALVLGMIPVTTGALAGVAAVAAGFGVVHGLTLGFGITLIGEAVDYAIYLFVQLGGDQGAARRTTWLRDFWPTIRLGTLTSLCGFAALLLSGFPGLAQLGLYSIAGLLAAALVTRYVMPLLLPQHYRMRDLTAWGLRLRTLAVALRARRWPRAVLLALAFAAATLLYVQRATLWQTELASLSPVSLAAQRLDEGLRAELGAPDVRQVIVVPGANRDEVLERAEAVGTVLQPLVETGAIGGFESPARFLPSAALQAERRAALPEPATLRARLEDALRELPLRPERIEPFIAEVDEARKATVLTPASLQGTSFATVVDSMLLDTSQGWRAMLPLRAVAAGSAMDLEAVRSALASANAPGAQLLDIKLESDSLYRGYLQETARLALYGLAALVGVLLLTLRSVPRVLRIVLPLLLAVLCTAALLSIFGRQLSLLHVVGLLLTVAIGSNYALFFDGAAEGHGLDTPQTYASVLLACTTSLLGFGVLAFSTVPVLQALGESVAPGGVLALLFSATLAASPASAPRQASA